MSRREECAACGADQHVCKMCLFYDANRANQCSEERAEEVTDKESANFCDYFEPRAGAWKKMESRKANSARLQLAVLFGDELPEKEAGSPLDDKQSEAEAAKRALAKLFGGSDKKD